MKAKIYSYKQLIGETNLQVGDVTTGRLFGNFIPVTSQSKKWKSAYINVQLENGIFLFPHGGYEIDNQKGKIEITGVNYKIIETFILINPLQPFVEEPWQALTIEQKISFEEELRKETGSNGKSIFSFLNNSPKHILSAAAISAFCYWSDDVLFEIKKPELNEQFALVHLTWRGKKERAGFPGTEFYSDFDEFKHSRMYADKAEWEE